jgi:hypothetical protein
MRFDLIRPCDNCPFRTDLQSGPYIRAGMVRDVLGSPDGRGEEFFPAFSFACHKTIDYSRGNAGRVHRKSQHCAGAAIILMRENKPNGAMQLAQRLLDWDPSKLDMTAPVYESRAACIAVHERASP